ncbi:hypothetical protein [Pedobacter sp. JY14-1]|uniref:hypothetical protein n=1 Tax=Pedobacter sp. JY14-1 TaxID=3034151 RepID=UPI0023E0B7C8|nr:hypothetical protein [Pedobacter sp. JY14-1]
MNKAYIRTTLLPCLFFAFPVLTIAVASCNKVDESIQRDVTIRPDTVVFTIPVISTLNSGSIAGDFPVTINVEQKIKDATKGEFGAGNLTDLRIASFKMELTIGAADTPDVNNNLGNFEAISVEIKADPYKATIAKTDANSASNIRTVTIGGGVNSPDLNTLLQKGSFRYDIRVKARKETTKTIEARVLPVFTATVKK